MITNETGVPDKETDQQRTPVGATPIVLNPKVQGESVNLCCPECGEEIECWSADNEPVFEYQCGCDELQKFKIKGVTDE